MLKGIANLFVMQRSGSKRSYDRQRAMIAELVAALSASAPESLEPHFRPTWEHAADDAGRLRVVVDQVASLTDISVVTWHKRHCRSSRGLLPELDERPLCVGELGPVPRHARTCRWRRPLEGDRRHRTERVVSGCRCPRRRA